MADDEQLGNERGPLQGVVLCCTSVPQHLRAKVEDVAVQMGAVHKLDLTSDVTHLLVGSVQTPKYRYVAKERPDIKVLCPDWLEAVRQKWMGGGEVDVFALEEEFRLPTFFGFKISITGFHNANQRDLMSSTIEDQGAEYHGDLTKEVTHLVAAAPKGSKYTHAKQWGLKVVSLKWFEDSLRRGMALDEDLYDPAMPVEEQGRGAFSLLPKRTISLGKRTRDEESQSTEAGRRKFRRTASARLHSQSQDMMTDLPAPGADAAIAEANLWKSDANQTSTEPPTKQDNKSALVQPLAKDTPFADADENRPGLFNGLFVLLRGFDAPKTNKLKEFLAPNGAEIVESVLELEGASKFDILEYRYLLVPHARPSNEISTSDIPPGTQIVTEWWLERCIHYKTLLKPGDDMLSQPFWHAKIDGFTKLRLCTTGFNGLDFRQIAEAIQLTGATYAEKMDSSASILICSADVVKPEKAFYAAKHGIMTVSVEWLWQCLKKRQLVPPGAFSLKHSTTERKTHTINQSASHALASEARSAETEKVANPAPLKRLSNTRKRPATPALSLQSTDRGTPLASSNRPPFVLEDEDAGGSADVVRVVAANSAAALPRHSQPLREIAPNASPKTFSQRAHELKCEEAAPCHGTSKTLRKESCPPSPESLHRSPPKEPRVMPASRPQEELTAELGALLKRQSSGQHAVDASDQPCRKDRRLGRNLSGISSRSLPAQSANLQDSSPGLAAHPVGSVADGFHVNKESVMPPSTQVEYETPEAEAHRAQMAKRMGLTFQEEGRRRVAGVGTVKDSLPTKGGRSEPVMARERPRRR